MEQAQIFISYSHKDQKALKQLQRFTQSLERDSHIKCWADTNLQGGDDWLAEINQAMDIASAAILFISQDFLASEFIWKPAFRLKLSLYFHRKCPNVQKAQVPVNRVVYGAA